MRALATVLSAGVLLAACGDGNSLEGSISESFSLEFDKVRIRKQNLALVVEYLHDIPGGTEKTCQVVLDTDGLNVGDNSTVKGSIFKERVQINRVGSGGDFPPIQEGQIYFDTFRFKDKGKVKGEFDAVLEGGRTLRGDFEGKVEEIVLD